MAGSNTGTQGSIGGAESNSPLSRQLRAGMATEPNSGGVGNGATGRNGGDAGPDTRPRPSSSPMVRPVGSVASEESSSNPYSDASRRRVSLEGRCKSV